MIQKVVYRLSLLETVYTWKDTFIDIRYMVSRYLYLQEMNSYDYAYEAYIHSYWNYLTVLCQ